MNTADTWKRSKPASRAPLLRWWRSMRAITCSSPRRIRASIGQRSSGPAGRGTERAVGRNGHHVSRHGQRRRNGRPTGTSRGGTGSELECGGGPSHSRVPGSTDVRSVGRSSIGTGIGHITVGTFGDRPRDPGLNPRTASWTTSRVRASRSERGRSEPSRAPTSPGAVVLGQRQHDLFRAISEHCINAAVALEGALGPAVAASEVVWAIERLGTRRNRCA